MCVTYDIRKGEWMLIGGFCLQMRADDVDLGLYGVNQSGFNGTMTAFIDGEGMITICPEISLDFDEYLFQGTLSDAELDLIPYQQTAVPYDQIVVQDLHEVLSDSDSSSDGEGPDSSSNGEGDGVF